MTTQLHEIFTGKVLLKVVLKNYVVLLLFIPAIKLSNEMVCINKEIR